MPELTPEQEAVVAEKAELDRMIANLKASIKSDKFEDVPLKEQARIFAQVASMKEHSAVLEDRIAAWDETRTEPGSI